MAKILIVEDDDAVRVAIERVVTTLGHVCRVADGGVTGIEAAESEDFALALVDMHMPGVDGLEVIKAIVRMTPRFPIIAISGGSPTTDVSEYEILARRLGAAMFLPKPFSISQLSYAITKVLANGPD